MKYNLEVLINKFKKKCKDFTCEELVKFILLFLQLCIALYIYYKYGYFIGVFALVMMLWISFPFVLLFESLFKKKEKRTNIYDYYNLNTNSTLFERREILIREYRNRIFYSISLILTVPSIILKVDFSFFKNNYLNIIAVIVLLFTTIFIVFRDTIINIRDIEEKISGTNKKYYEKEDLVMIVNTFFRYLFFYISLVLLLISIKEFKDERKEKINTVIKIEISSANKK